MQCLSSWYPKACCWCINKHNAQTNLHIWLMHDCQMKLNCLKIKVLDCLLTTSVFVLMMAVEVSGYDTADWCLVLLLVGIPFVVSDYTLKTTLSISCDWKLLGVGQGCALIFLLSEMKKKIIVKNIWQNIWSSVQNKAISDFWWNAKFSLWFISQLFVRRIWQFIRSPLDFYPGTFSLNKASLTKQIKSDYLGY